MATVVGGGANPETGLMCRRCVCVLSHFSRVLLFVTLWTARFLCPWDFPQESWRGLPFPPEDFLDPGFEPKPPVSPESQAHSLPLSRQGSFVHTLLQHAQSCPTLCPLMNCSLRGSSVCGDPLGRVAIPSSRDLPDLPYIK